ncbi:MAG: TonB-dependent receptor [Acidobacteria bacterium]|nr:TonB-dependent receptor [Acidobacteriota bacterium]
MQRVMRHLGLLLVLLAMVPPSLIAQTGRAAITGIATDPTGAVIPGVNVTAVQAQTGVEYRGVSNDAGYYTIGSLPVGEYSVTYVAAGFTEFTRNGIALQAGQVARIDVVMKIGAVAEKLTVTARADMVETETAQSSKSVDSAGFTDLPLSFGEGRNMVEFAAKLVPGVQQANMYMRIQGTPSMSQSVVVDGMNVLTGRLPGDFMEASISPEAVQEMTVFTGNANAEYGRGAGGTVNFSLKSGTNSLHGSAFGYLRNEVLNANSWNNNLMLAPDPDFKNASTQNFLRPRSRQDVYGFSVGGPVILPKVYDGRNRTFFYFTMEKFGMQNPGPTNLVITTPQPEMFDGDLSRLLTGRRVGTDALGRTVTEGQVYDPATLREVNGQFVADPFLGNIIPMSRISKVARTLKQVFTQHYPPVNSNLQNNMYSTRWVQEDITQESIKVDHVFSPAHKISGFLYYFDSPQWTYTGTANRGLWSLAAPTNGGPLSTDRSWHPHGPHWNVNYDWVISPTLLNHASFGASTDNLDSVSYFKGKGLHDEWGIQGVGLGYAKDKITEPVFNLAASPVMTVSSPWGSPSAVERHHTNYVANDSLSWQRHSHFFKVGAEFMRMGALDNTTNNSGGTFNFVSYTTGIPGQPYTSRIGNSFASFLLGEVNGASLNVPLFPLIHRVAISAFVQDDWKVTRRLTLNLGLRWSGDTAVTESQDRIANFNPYLPDPNGNNLPGAVEYMGSGPGRAGRRSTAPGYYKNFGPVVGFAYQVAPRTVLRGSYSITYTPESISTTGNWEVMPGNFTAGFAQINTVQANSNGIYRPVFNIDNGYPGKTEPVNLDPSWGQKRPSVMISPDIFKAGYVQQFHFGLQFQPSQDLVVETSWRASKGTRLHSGNSVVPNQIHEQDLSRGAVLGQIINTPQKAAAAGLPYPYAGWSGLGANTLQPFPQINTQGLTAWGDTVGFSNYQSGNLIVTKRMSKGLTAYGAYTFSKSITNVVTALGPGDSTGLQDSYNRGLYKSIDPADRTHVLKASILWQLPVGRGKAILGGADRILNAIVGNWTVSTLFNYSSGTALGHPGSRNRPVGWNGPGLFANFNTPSGGFNRLFDPAKFNPWDPNDPGNRFFDPAAFSDTVGQQLGTSPVYFPQIRMRWTFNEDAAIAKRFPVTEKARVELRVEFFNLFNRHYFGAPDLNMNDKYFGNVWTANGNRVGQAGLRVEW